jgi:hypothetical protein
VNIIQYVEGMVTAYCDYVIMLNIGCTEACLYRCIIFNRDDNDA